MAFKISDQETKATYCFEPSHPNSRRAESDDPRLREPFQSEVRAAPYIEFMSTLERTLSQRKWFDEKSICAELQT